MKVYKNTILRNISILIIGGYVDFIKLEGQCNIWYSVKKT